MAIDTRIAARIARENGLTLADVRALTLLADTEEEAEELAAQFAPDTTDIRDVFDKVDV